MAFDLKKNDGSTPKVDLSKKTSSKFNLTKEGNSTVPESTIVSGNGKNGGSKKVVFLLLGIVIIGISILYFSSKKDTNLAPEQAITAVATNDSTVLPVSAVNDTTSAEVEGTQVAEKPIETKKVIETSQSKEKPSPSNNTTEKVVENSRKMVKPLVSSKTQVSSIPQGTIEEKAKQAIRGDYGNGIERKNALGSEYKEVQKRINEMYRKGEL